VGKYLLEAEAGESIHNLIQRAVNQANILRRDLQLKHNGIIINVYVGSHEYDLAEKFELKRQLLNSRADWK
jgi:hypothetical protein